MIFNKKIEIMWRVLSMHHYGSMLESNTLNNLHFKVGMLEDRIRHLENASKAEELMREFKELNEHSGASVCYQNTFLTVRFPEIISTEIYTLEKFECEVLCPLRKARLAKLTARKAKT